MKIIVGLGNPGLKYESSRHNVGFMFLDYVLGQDLNWEYSKKFNLEYIFVNSCYYIKPLSYMNNSGIPLRAFMDYYKILPKKMGIFRSSDSDLSDILTVVHDDLDINLGSYKKSVNASSAGHRGVESIIREIKTKNFTRIRIGINSEDRRRIPTEKFVLQRFQPEELNSLKQLFQSIEIK